MTEHTKTGSVGGEEGHLCQVAKGLPKQDGAWVFDWGWGVRQCPPVCHGGMPRVVIHWQGDDGSVPPTPRYMEIQDGIGLHKSCISVAMELQFMKCAMSVESNLGTKSLRKTSLFMSHHLWVEGSLTCLLLNWIPLHIYVFLCFLLRAHKNIGSAEVAANYRILIPVRTSCK